MFSFLLYMDRAHEKGNLSFSLDFFCIPAPTPLNYVHSVGAALHMVVQTNHGMVNLIMDEYAY